MTPPELPPRQFDLDIPRRLARWALWSCATLALVLVFLVLGVALVVIKSPTGQARWKWSRDMLACEANLREVSGALARYQQDKGHLPDRLEDIYPVYLRDGGTLRCPLDTARPKPTSYRYRPWVDRGAANEVLVYCPWHPGPPAWSPMIPFSKVPRTPAIMADLSVERIPFDAAALEQEDARHIHLR